MKVGDLEIEIYCRLGVVNRVEKDKGKWNVVSIYDPHCGRAPIECFAKSCKEILKLRFHDYDDRVSPLNCGPEISLPQKRDVQKVLEWANGKTEILVHCFAGISRSSAMAYLIACTRVSALEALGILDGKLHWPNKRIVRIGSEVLGRPEILREYESWQKRNQ
jgi:predicted protein tyrosine phosphatase